MAGTLDVYCNRSPWKCSIGNELEILTSIYTVTGDQLNLTTDQGDVTLIYASTVQMDTDQRAAKSN